MTHVDALSRAPVEDAKDTGDYLVEQRMGDMMMIEEETVIDTVQGCDSRLRKIIELLRQPRRSSDEDQQVRGYTI